MESYSLSAVHQNLCTLLGYFWGVEEFVRRYQRSKPNARDIYVPEWNLCN